MWFLHTIINALPNPLNNTVMPWFSSICYLWGFTLKQLLAEHEHVKESSQIIAIVWMEENYSISFPKCIFLPPSLFFFSFLPSFAWVAGGTYFLPDSLPSSITLNFKVASKALQIYGKSQTQAKGRGDNASPFTVHKAHKFFPKEKPEQWEL